MKITSVSDLHGYFPILPGGDLLIVAGDLTASDAVSQYTHFADWLLAQDYRKKVFIAGNHDTKIENGEYYFNHDWLGYLQDSGIEFEGYKIWGSPWTLTFPKINPKCKAFVVDTEQELAEKFSKIPQDTDILVTHSPAYGMLDKAIDGRLCGSTALRHAVNRLRLKLHVFGHIHESAGVHVPILEFCGLEGYPISFNASYVDEKYRPINEPRHIEL